MRSRYIFIYIYIYIDLGGGRESALSLIVFVPW